MGFKFVIKYIREGCYAKKILFYKLNTNESNNTFRENNQIKYKERRQNQ